MTFLERIGTATIAATRGFLSAFGYIYRPQGAVRGFQAAKVTRLTNDWVNTSTTPNEDIRAGLSIIRQRARDLMQNNDYAKKYRRLLSQNILNHQANGFKLQMDCGEFNGSGEFVADKLANAKIEAAWADWAKPEHCSWNGQYTFRAIQDLLVSGLGRDGEGVIRFVADRGSKYGLRLEVIPPEMIDERFNKVLDNGNEVVMGVEFDDWSRPVAYHLKSWDSGSITRTHERVPASEIILGFDREFPNQARGVSWLASTMAGLKMLSDYDMAALTNAKAAASKMGFIETAAGEGAEGWAGKEGDDAAGNPIMDIEPGVIEELAPGQKFSPWDPQYPNGEHEVFIKSSLRRTAAGLGVSYASLSADLADANYSSNRVGMLDEREGWKMLQTWFIETYMVRIFERWLEAALVSGAVMLPFKWEKFNRPIFIGRRWDWIDPEKDVNAKLLERQMGVNTLRRIAAERGEDIEDIFKEIAEEEALAAKYGIVLKVNEINVPQPKVGIPANGQSKLFLGTTNGR